MKLSPLLGLLAVACGSGAVSGPPAPPPPAVSSVITITPSDKSCAPAICSGGDAIVTAQLTQGDQPVAGKPVRFSVTSGDLRLITAGETLDATETVSSDSTGKAVVRIRALPDAANQSGLLQVTDVTSGSSQISGVQIAHVTPSVPAFFVSPDTVTFSGPTTSQCATGARADIAVFGGTPPYLVLPSGAQVAVGPTNIPTSGGVFSVTAAGFCGTFPISVLDSAGRVVSLRVSNVLGTVSPPALDVEPPELTLASCDSVGTFVFTGGTGVYSATPSDNSLMQVSLAGSSASFQRNPGVKTAPAKVSVVVTSGAEVKTVTVDVSAGAITCP